MINKNKLTINIYKTQWNKNNNNDNNKYNNKVNIKII